MTTIFSIIKDKGGVGASLLAYHLTRRTLDFEPSTCLIDCDDDQFTSKDFSDDRRKAGVMPHIPVFNIATKNLEKELINLSKQYKIIFIEFGKAGKEDEFNTRNEAVELAIKLSYMIICPLQPTPVDVRAFTKFAARLPVQISNVKSIIIPNRVKSLNQLKDLRAAEASLKHFTISNSFLADRLCYQEVFGYDGRTIFDIKPSSDSEKGGLREMEQLFMEIIYGA